MGQTRGDKAIFLFSAIDGDDVGRLRETLAQGANPNYQNGHSGDTPLIYALRRNAEQCITELLSHPIDLRLANRRGETALMVASGRGNWDLAAHLIAQGSPLNALDQRGFTALRHARQHHQESSTIVQRLVLHGAQDPLK